MSKREDSRMRGKSMLYDFGYGEVAMSCQCPSCTQTVDISAFRTMGYTLADKIRGYKMFFKIRVFDTTFSVTVDDEGEILSVFTDDNVLELVSCAVEREIELHVAAEFARAMAEQALEDKNDMSAQRGLAE